MYRLKQEESWKVVIREQTMNLTTITFRQIHLGLRLRCVIISKAESRLAKNQILASELDKQRLQQIQDNPAFMN